MTSRFDRAVAAALLSALSYPAAAQEADPETGRDLFMTYCWQCHGMEATGGGPMAEMLAIETPDLTGISRRNGGAFPAFGIARQIDGRDPVLAHGGEMPIFGPTFDAGRPVALRDPDGAQMLVGQPLADVIAWLETVQAP